MGHDAAGHVPVLVEEVVFLLRLRRSGWLVDGTVGGGGHAEALMERAPAGSRLLGVDADPEALARAHCRLARFGSRVVLRRGNFRELGMIAREAGVNEAQTVLLDLGVSSFLLAASGRGFSFSAEEPLDMRFDPSTGATAAELLGSLSEAELTRIVSEYGGEPHARRIARSIVTRRQSAPLRTTGELVAAVKSAIPRAAWSRRRHVATRTFQAVRMAVNDEPGSLAEALPAAAGLLAPGGRLGVISFHSGEDRVVKRAFRSLSGGEWALVNQTPVVPCREERRANPRARSAKLRVIERLDQDHGAA
ncbi:MAG: 16S rRNA (cytosine(1402)-N(4))-methyltransferase RsmH [candidate division NC10 bacterium]